MVVDTPATRVAECLVGDATGVVVLSARGAEQVEMAVAAAAAAASSDKAGGAAGAVLRLRRARVDMYRGSMRLYMVAGDGGAMEPVMEAGAVPSVDEGNNVSLLEFELVQAQSVAFRPAGEVVAGAREAAAAAAARAEAQATAPAGGKGAGRKGKGKGGAAAAAAEADGGAEGEPAAEAEAAGGAAEADVAAAPAAAEAAAATATAGGE